MVVNAKENFGAVEALDVILIWVCKPGAMYML